MLSAAVSLIMTLLVFVCGSTLITDLIDTQEIKPSAFSVQTVAVHNKSCMIDYCIKPFNPGVELVWMAFWQRRLACVCVCVCLLMWQINACTVVLNLI